MVRRRGSAIGWRTRLRHNDRKAIAKPEGGRKAALFRLSSPRRPSDVAAEFMRCAALPAVPKARSIRRAPQEGRVFSLERSLRGARFG